MLHGTHQAWQPPSGLSSHDHSPAFLKLHMHKQRSLSPSHFKWNRKHQYYMATKGAGHSMHSVWQEKCLHVPVTTFSTPGHLSCSLIKPCGEQLVYCIPTTLHKMMGTDYPRHRNIYQKNWALCFMEFSQSLSQIVSQSFSQSVM